MKKIISLILTLTLVLSGAAFFASCQSESSFTIAVPNDTTNEARALLLLESCGVIEVDSTKGLAVTVKDITSNPKNIKFVEVEAAQLPNKLADVDYAVINTNYALAANLNPKTDALAIEGSASAYANILSVKAGNENTPKTLALKAALESQRVAEYIASEFGGSVVSVAENPGDGYDASLNYEELKGLTISVAASPTPHAQILQVAKEILADKEITLNIIEFTDYDQPNLVVDSGEVDANYFQHVPYLESFNSEKGTNLVSVAKIHVEPMGIYGGKQTSLDAIK